MNELAIVLHISLHLSSHRQHDKKDVPLKDSSLMKEIIVTTEFDFEYWMKLAEDNPEQFEKERIRVIEEAILGAPSYRQKELRCLQWRIDMVRDRSSNPLSDCIHISRMMMDSVFGEGRLVDSIKILLGKEKKSIPKEALILPFHKK